MRIAGTIDTGSLGKEVGKAIRERTPGKEAKGEKEARERKVGKEERKVEKAKERRAAGRAQDPCQKN